MKRRFSHRRSPSSSPPIAALANVSPRPLPDDHIFTPEISADRYFRKVELFQGRAAREERKRERAGIPQSPPGRPPPPLLPPPIASSTPRRPAPSNSIYTPEHSPNTVFNRVRELKDRADPTGEHKECRQLELQRKMDKLIHKYIKTPVVTESEDEYEEEEVDEDEEGKELMELMLFEGELRYPVTAHVDVEFEEFDAPECDESKFSERPPHTILMEHAYCLAPFRYLNQAAKYLSNNRHESQINNILLFYAYYLELLKKFPAFNKPLTSFVGETFEVDLQKEYGIRALLEMVEVDTVAMHVRGDGWVLEQHLKPNDTATGFVGGGNIVFGKNEDEVGIEIDISTLEQRRVSDWSQAFLMFGIVKALPTASKVVGTLTVGEQSGVGVQGYAGELEKPHFCTFNGKYLTSSFKASERERTPRVSNNWVTTSEKMDSFRKQNFGLFAEAINTKYVLNAVDFTDSRNRRDVKLIQEGLFKEAEHVYKEACRPKFKAREEMPPRSKNFRCRCVNGKKFWELRVHPVAGNYFDRKKKKFETAFDKYGWKKLGKPWGERALGL